jgi:PTS system mannose-specific IIC component
MTGGIMARSLMVSFAAGALSLDRTAAFQSMVSRPLVVAPLTGWLLGDASAGLMIGVALEIILMGDIPVGRHLPTHDTGVAIAAAAFGVTALDSFRAAGAEVTALWALLAVPASVLAALPAARVYQRADSFIRRFNARFFHAAAASLEAGGADALMRENLKGLAVFFAVNTAAFIITIAPLMYIAGWAPAAIHPSSMWPAAAGLAAIGASAALGALNGSRGLPAFAAGAAAGAALWMALA